MKKIKDPLVSIILPTYNRLTLLKRAIKSVKSQAYRNWQLIIINDGSADGTSEYLKSIDSDKRIKILNHKHTGVVPSAKGIKVAIGEIITFLGDDDYYKPNHLKKIVPIFTKDQSWMIVHGIPKVIGAKMVTNIHPPHKLISINKCILGGTLFVRSEVIKKIKLLPEKKYGNDYFLHNKIINLGYRCHKINMPSYIYDRRGDDSITKNRQSKVNKK